MTEALSRASLLRGRFSDPGTTLRPPWALAEPAFLETCSRCADCLRVCPEKIVVEGSGGFPTIDFSAGECTFCGLCVETCADDALVSGFQAPWHQHATAGPSCLARSGVVCRSCEEACEPRAIHFKLGPVALPEIDDEACTGCGACVSICPVRAIEVTRQSEVPS